MQIDFYRADLGSPVRRSLPARADTDSAAFTEIGPFLKRII